MPKMAHPTRKQEPAKNFFPTDTDCVIPTIAREVA